MSAPGLRQVLPSSSQAVIEKLPGREDVDRVNQQIRSFVADRPVMAVLMALTPATSSGASSHAFREQTEGTRMDGSKAMDTSRDESDWQQEEETGKQDGEPGVSRVVEQSRRVRSDLEGLMSAVFEARTEWESQLRERLVARPYVGLATAAGIGYVLGAGISPGLIRTVFGLGTRVGLAVMMRRLAAPVTEMVVGRTP